MNSDYTIFFHWLWCQGLTAFGESRTLAKCRSAAVGFLHIRHLELAQHLEATQLRASLELPSDFEFRQALLEKWGENPRSRKNGALGPYAGPRRGCSWSAAVLAGLLIGLLGLSLSGCAAAGALEGNTFVAPSQLEFRPPDPAHWRMTYNRRRGHSIEVRWKYRQNSRNSAVLRIRSAPTSDPTYLPLEVLAEQRALKLGIEAARTYQLNAMVPIVLDERRAIACLGSSLDRPVPKSFSLIVLASQGYEVELFFEAPKSLFEELSPDLEMLLRHFHLLLPGTFDPFKLEGNAPGAPAPTSSTPAEFMAPLRPPIDHELIELPIN